MLTDIKQQLEADLPGYMLKLLFRLSDMDKRVNELTDRIQDLERIIYGGFSSTKKDNNIH